MTSSYSALTLYLKTVRAIEIILFRLLQFITVISFMMDSLVLNRKYATLFYWLHCDVVLALHCAEYIGKGAHYFIEFFWLSSYKNNFIIYF